MTNLSTRHHSDWTRIQFSGPWPYAAYDWCYEKFGVNWSRHDPSENGKWVYCGQRSFEFKHEEDAVLFALRWV